MNSSEFGRIPNTSTNIVCPLKDTSLSSNLKLFSILFVGGFGILNNVFIIVLAIKYVPIKNLHHLIINMAVADILNVFALFGLNGLSIINRLIWHDIKTISGDSVCKFFSFFANCSMLASYTTLVIVTIERFRASRQTLQISQPYTLIQRLAVVFCSWLISGALAAYDTPYRAIEYSFDGLYACKGSSKVPLGLTIFVFTLLSIAFYFIIILSALILRKLSHRNEIEASLSEAQRKARAKRISGAIKMVLSSLLLYTLCYVPVSIWSFIISFSVNAFRCYEFYILDFLLVFLPLVNSCFSPGIYLIFLGDFREAAKTLVCRTASNSVHP